MSGAEGKWPFLLFLVVFGCGRAEQTFPVDGMVVFPDGTPLTSGSVEFESLDHSPPVTAVADIRPDGTFVLGTWDTSDGAVPGRHRVAVLTGTHHDEFEERPEKLPKPLILPQYRDARTSGLEFSVTKGNNSFLIEVFRPSDAPETLKKPL